MGVFSELDLENQQTELDGHDSKAAEMQTLQAKLIQQHEQKKAAAAAEAPGKEPAAYKYEYDTLGRLIRCVQTEGNEVVQH